LYLLNIRKNLLAKKKMLKRCDQCIGWFQGRALPSQDCGRVFPLSKSDSASPSPMQWLQHSLSKTKIDLFEPSHCWTSALSILNKFDLIGQFFSLRLFEAIALGFG